MKVLLSLLALASMLAFTGCKTVTAADGSTARTADPIVLHAVAQDAAAVGTIVLLQQHPEYRPSLELARTSLRALVAAGDGSTADLQAILSGLPIKQLQGTQGAIIVSSAVVLIDAAGAQLKTTDKRQVWANFVQPVASGVLAGLDAAMGPEQ